MAIDLDAYDFAAISLTWNDPVTKMHEIIGEQLSFTLETRCTLGVLLLKLCLACSAQSGNSFLATSSTSKP